MKKTIIKTICITLAALIGICVATYFIFALAAPKRLGDFLDGLNMHSLAIKNYERQYKKTNDNEDLYVLASKIDEKNESAKAAKYLLILTESPEFSDFCKTKDKAGKKITTEEFLCGKLSAALTYDGEFSKAVQNAENYFNKNGYTSYNPFRIFVFELKSSLKDEQKIIVKTKLRSIYDGLTDETVKQTVASDIDALG